MYKCAISHSIQSDCVISNTGTPQGMVLAPFLFTVYTSDCRSRTEECPLIKFADDTAMAGLVAGDDESAFQCELDDSCCIL